MKIEFKEEQKFTQWWLWLILIGIGIMPFFGIYERFSQAGEIESSASSNISFTIFSLIIFGLIALFLFTSLKTEIDKDEIRMNFFPFSKKTVSWKDVKSAEVLNYGFVGGWGIRLWTNYGTAYNIKGNKGLAIELLNGEKFLIGTQKEDEMHNVMNEIKSQNL